MDAQLRARATDGTGQRQPETVPFNSNGYLFWATVRHPVVVGRGVSVTAQDATEECGA